ncbi:unnamed protein product [Bemisia tabaci]|uniref:protein-histidine N-methyltransferase n=1 Tax=Bemisia tabaci TaxID=7038 RepID=A0A9P0F2N7_BEMTA|nr:unnamed protein product [Bemisia tabaci]
MFKFNFDAEECEASVAEIAESNELIWDPFKEVSTEETISASQDCITKFTCRDLQFQIVDASKSYEKSQTEELKSCSIFQSLQTSHSDLLTAKYEGGFKIWECTYDLLHYLIDNNIDLRNKTILDLGCGVGILGMYALQNGATVHFQDYNVDVLKYATIPSVSHSFGNTNNCRFFAGDWSFFCEENTSTKYDCILSSETIYNPKNYDKLCAVFEEKLKPNGYGLLGAKSFYFGVGGSTLEFEKKVDARKKLNCSKCWTFSGLQREILKISHLS